MDSTSTNIGDAAPPTPRASATDKGATVASVTSRVRRRLPTSARRCARDEFPVASITTLGGRDAVVAEVDGIPPEGRVVTLVLARRYRLLVLTESVVIRGVHSRVHGKIVRRGVQDL